MRMGEKTKIKTISLKFLRTKLKPKSVVHGGRNGEGLGREVSREHCHTTTWFGNSRCRELLRLFPIPRKK